MSDRSQNWELVSTRSADTERFGEKRRLPRLSLTQEQFKLTSTGKIFPVADVSLDGLAIRILDREDMRLFQVGSLVEGTLNVQRQKVAIRARVRHLGSELVGCQFENLAEGTRKLLNQVLNPAELGKELRPIPSVEPGMVWYQGCSGANVLLWRGLDGQYQRLLASALGRFSQWEATEGVSTGVIKNSMDAVEARGVVRFETVVLERDATPDDDKLNVAKTLIMSSNFPEDLKGWCLRHFDLTI